jgi:hypothetical protein
MQTVHLRWLIALAAACHGAAPAQGPTPPATQAPVARGEPRAAAPARTEGAPAPGAPASGRAGSRAAAARAAAEEAAMERAAAEEAARAAAEEQAAAERAVMPPPPRYRVAVVLLATPYGDVNAPQYADRVTKLLRRVAAEKGTHVAMPDPFAACVRDIQPCAIEAGKRARADVVIYGMLIHGTEAGSTEVRLESVETSSAKARTWEETITMDSDHFFEVAARSAYQALVETPP